MLPILKLLFFFYKKKFLLLILFNENFQRYNINLFLSLKQIILFEKNFTFFSIFYMRLFEFYYQKLIQH